MLKETVNGEFMTTQLSRRQLRLVHAVRPWLLIKRYQRLIGVVLFLGVLLAVFEWSGLRGHFNLAFMRQVIEQHQVGGLLIFVLLFSLGNLIQIPGWIFLPRQCSRLESRGAAL